MSVSTMSDHVSLLRFGEPPSFPPIAKGKSAPRDSMSPSFLTMFPAEVRNAVYDVLFHVPHGIRVTYTACCSFEDQELREDIAASLALLSTCRQIYQEAATTLLSNNTWIVSRDLSSMSDHSPRNGTMYKAKGAAYILRKFGSRKTMVKRVLLDLDRECPVPCHIHQVLPRNCHGTQYNVDEHSLEMWSLVEEMALLPDIKVEFVHPKRQTYYDLHPRVGGTQADIGVQLDLLNTTLQTLRKDAIGIRKYGRQFDEVYIEKDCTQGHVIFRMANAWMDMKDRVKLRFVIADEGRTLTWARLEKQPPTLMNLLWHIKEAILENVSFVDNGRYRSKGLELVWDVDRKILTGGSLVAGAICRDIRFGHYTGIWHDKNHTVKMGTSQLRTDFGRFQNLGRFVAKRRPDILTMPYGVPLQVGGVKLLLEFNIPCEVTLEDVRLNIVNLLRITATLISSTKVTVSIAGE